MLYLEMFSRNSEAFASEFLEKLEGMNRAQIYGISIVVIISRMRCVKSQFLSLFFAFLLHQITRCRFHYRRVTTQ